MIYNVVLISAEQQSYSVIHTYILFIMVYHRILNIQFPVLYSRTLFLQSPVFKIYLFIYLFLAMLGLRFCARAFSSCDEWGPLFIAVHGPLTIAASLVAEHRLQARRLSSCGSRAQLLRGMWDLPRPGLEPVSPALKAGSQPLRHQGSPKVPRFELPHSPDIEMHVQNGYDLNSLVVTATNSS